MVRAGQAHGAAPALFALWPLIASVFVKSGLAWGKFHYGRQAGSTALQADAWHDASEIFSGLVALAAVDLAIADPAHFAAADAWGGVAVGLFIIGTSIHIVHGATFELIDTMPERERIDRLREIAAMVPGVVGIEKAYARKTGLGYHAELHVEVDPELTVREAHEIAFAGAPAAARTAHLGRRCSGAYRTSRCGRDQAREEEMIRSTFVGLLLGLSLIAQEKREDPPLQPKAVEEKIPEIVTDRPDVTEAATVVPRGSLQFENGFTWTREAGKSSIDLSQTLMRYGLTPRWELRLEVPDFLITSATRRSIPALAMWRWVSNANSARYRAASTSRSLRRCRCLPEQVRSRAMALIRS